MIHPPSRAAIAPGPWDMAVRRYRPRIAQPGFSAMSPSSPPPSSRALLVHGICSSQLTPAFIARHRHMILPSKPPDSKSTLDSAMLPDHSLAAQTNLLQRLRGFMSVVQRFLRPNKARELAKRLPQTRQDTQHRNPAREAISHRIPRGAWDSHMHVVDPDNYPLAPGAVYRPRPHSLDTALSFESSVGIDNIVLVQPSIYGHDNSCLLDALRRLGPRRGRGVVSFDPSTTSLRQLQEWHDLGVRGVRVNIQSHGVAVDSGHLANILRRYADKIRPLNWALQVYVPMWLIEPLEAIIPTLNIRFCIDHMGSPCLKNSKSGDPYELAGFRSLVRLLEGGHTFIKLSAPYRMSQLGGHIDLEPVAREIIRLKGMSSVVFATDWPHTRFEGLDIRPWMDAVLDWCEDDAFLIDRLFRGNAEALWDVTTA